MKTFFAVVLLLLVITKIECNTKTECGVAQTAFSMCVPYVMGDEKETLSHSCCDGVSALKDLSLTNSPRGLCNCLKNLMAQVGKIDSRRAIGLAKKCGVDTRVIPTSLNFPCFRIA